MGSEETWNRTYWRVTQEESHANNGRQISRATVLLDHMFSAFYVFAATNLPSSDSAIFTCSEAFWNVSLEAFVITYVPLPSLLAQPTYLKYHIFLVRRVDGYSAALLNGCTSAAGDGGNSPVGNGAA